MDRMTRRLLMLLEGLKQKEKENYYRVCGIADRRLKRDGYRPLNVPQCEMICERLRTGRDITMKDIQGLALGGRIAPRPAPPVPEKELTLFDCSEPGSSSSSDPTNP